MCLQVTYVNPQLPQDCRPINLSIVFVALSNQHYLPMSDQSAWISEHSRYSHLHWNISPLLLVYRECSDVSDAAGSCGNLLTFSCQNCMQLFTLQSAKWASSSPTQEQLLDCTAVSWFSTNGNKSSSVNCSLTSLDWTTVPNIVTIHLSSLWYDGNSKPIKHLIKM